MKYLIKNGLVIDPLNKIEGQFDLLISGDKIERVAKSIGSAGAEIIDAKGKIVAPGLVDMHAHLREPGREDEETVRTGTRAAVKGGFTRIACMPNTEPAIDTPESIRALKAIIERDALAKVSIVGAITKGRIGKELVDLAAIKKEGAEAVSDDGSSVKDEGLLLEALKLSKSRSLLLIEHCEDTALSAGGVVNQGFVSTKMGLKGISRRSEYERVGRDISLAKKASCRIHIAHISCRESVELIRRAKCESIEVTAETAPHYFTLTEDCCAAYDTNTKMNPPLRGAEDVKAIVEGLRDGTIDVIATDHAPHTDSEKDVEFDFAPFGIIGLETGLSLSIMELVEKKALSWGELILKMSANPARIMGVAGGSLGEGKAADIVIIDATKDYIYKKEHIESKSKNSPFIDWRMKGRAASVFVSGTLVMKDGAIMG